MSLQIFQQLCYNGNSIHVWGEKMNNVFSFSVLLYQDNPIYLSLNVKTTDHTSVFLIPLIDSQIECIMSINLFSTAETAQFS